MEAARRTAGRTWPSHTAAMFNDGAPSGQLSTGRGYSTSRWDGGTAENAPGGCNGGENALCRELGSWTGGGGASCNDSDGISIRTP